MRIAIISPTYQEHKSYQENLWAEEFNRQGEEVWVFSCLPVTQKSSILWDIKTDIHSQLKKHEMGYQVLRIPTFVLPRDLFLTQNLAFALECYQADLILWFGVGTFFELSVLRSKILDQVQSICFFSLSRAGRHSFLIDDIHSLPSCIQALGFQFLRSNLYSNAILRSSMVVCNTPEGYEILSELLVGKSKKVFEEKQVQFPLAYCAYTFHFSLQTRMMLRAQYGVKEEEVILLYSTRFEEDKKVAIDHYIALLRSLITKNPLIKGFLIGFNENAMSLSYLQELDDLVQNNHLICFPFQSRTELSALYQGSDMSYFPQPSISIQEALGTGLWVFHTKDSSIDHLIEYSDRISSCESEQLEDDLLKCSVSSILKDNEHRLSSSIKAQALSSVQLRIKVLDRLKQITAHQS